MIDRNLNYGRDIIELYFQKSQPYSNVLDIGAGSGVDLLLGRKINPSAKLHAIEVYNQAAEKLVAHNIQVMPIDLERDAIPLADQSMDIVVANQVLEHVKELFWIFHEVSRVMKVGGEFIIGVPNLAGFQNRILLACGLQPSPIKNWSAHIRGYTKGDLLEFLDRCWAGGFQLEEFRGANFYPFPPFIAKPLAKMFPNLAWAIFFRIKKRKSYAGEFLKYLETAQLETNFYRGPSGALKSFKSVQGH